jgi:macrolide transport system ATP-binding/permease protein
MHTLTQPIIARGIDRWYGDRRILSGVDITVSPHARTGLIGENGVPKSTLLRILAGVETPDGGTVERRARSGILWQDAPVDETSARRGLCGTIYADARKTVSRCHSRKSRAGRSARRSGREMTSR